MRVRRHSVGLVAGFALVAAPACSTEIDTAPNRLSDAGLFEVSFESRLDPIEINRMHEWVVHVTRPDGAAVEDAIITIAGGMPAHSHGLPTAPQATTNLGGGDYLVEGLKFQMKGHWQVTFGIAAGERTDSVTFNLVL